MVQRKRIIKTIGTNFVGGKNLILLQSNLKYIYSKQQIKLKNFVLLSQEPLNGGMGY